MYGFKDFDVRGTQKEGVTEELAEKLGIYYPDIIKTKKIIVGHDHRKTSQKFLKRLIKGLKSRGMQVYDIGLSSSPMFYHLTSKYKFKEGIMITASHSPKEQNGFKFVKKHAQPVYSVNGLNELEELVIKSPKRENKKGTLKKIKNSVKKYHDDMINFAHPKRKLKIVVDLGNGMGSLDIPFLKKIANVKTINEKINPNFPGRGPNPILHGVLKKLQETVKKTKSDFGVGYDGDADRSVFVDNKGNIILSDYMTALFTEHLTKKGDSIVYDLRLSKVIEEIAKKKGVKSVKSKVGHSRVVDKMIEKKGKFGSEYSCHFYFKEIDYTDSGLFATIQLINILSKQNKPLDELLEQYKKYEISEEINLKVDRSKVKLFKKEKGKKSYLDGITIKKKDVWYNVRKSHTEDLVRIRAEAKNKKILKETIKKIKEKLQS